MMINLIPSDHYWNDEVTFVVLFTPNDVEIDGVIYHEFVEGTYFADKDEYCISLVTYTDNEEVTNSNIADEEIIAMVKGIIDYLLDILSRLKT